MKHFLSFIFKVLTFGLTRLVKLLVKSKTLKSQYHFDIDKDGDVDATITFHSDENQKSDQEEDKS